MIYCSGCLHACKGCHNPESHNFDSGRMFTNELQQDIITYIRQTPFVSGLTLSGGDPMYSAVELTPFIRTIREAIPNISIWIYSGFTFENILDSTEKFTLLKLCDVLVDGEFVLEQRDVTIPYRGSRNQRIIDIQSSIKSERVILYNENNRN